jgi:predicted dehydrogenase
MSMKVVMLGAGGFGNNWRPSLDGRFDTQVVALVDSNPSALKEAGERYNVPEERRYSYLSDQWQEVEADIILDSTPHFLHYGNAIRGISTGHNIIFCKPMCVNMRQALEIVKFAEANKVKITVAQQLRFSVIIRKLAEIIQNGQFGRISSVYLEWHSTVGLSHSWRLEQPDFMLMEGSIHHLDFARMILGTDAKTVIAQTWKDLWNTKKSNDSCAAVFEMENGTMLNYCATWTGKSQPFSDWWCDWRIEAENGWITVRNGDVRVNGEPVDIGTREEYQLNLAQHNVEIFRETKAWIEGGPEPGFSGQNNLPSLAMIFGARQSATEGKRLNIEPENWGELE